MRKRLDLSFPGSPARKRLDFASLGFLAALLVAGSVAAAGIDPERVTFDSLDRDLVTGAPVRISALLFRPEGASGERHATVIVLHGCVGMYSAVKSRRNELSLRHQAMAELLVGESYVVLFPDSFCARGRDEICTIENRLRTITQVNRGLDVPNGVHPGQRVTVAPNPDARADAYLRLKGYLRTELAERFDDGSAAAAGASR